MGTAVSPGKKVATDKTTTGQASPVRSFVSFAVIIGLALAGAAGKHARKLGRLANDYPYSRSADLFPRAQAADLAESGEGSWVRTAAKESVDPIGDAVKAANDHRERERHARWAALRHARDRELPTLVAIEINLPPSILPEAGVAAAGAISAPSAQPESPMAPPNLTTADWPTDQLHDAAELSVPAGGGEINLPNPRDPAVI